jgi:hypothetical protein
MRGVIEYINLEYNINIKYDDKFEILYKNFIIEIINNNLNSFIGINDNIRLIKNII